MRNPKETRTCLGCFKKENKKSLFKLVRSIDEKNNIQKVEIDLEQTKEGRGAYICSVKCLDKAFKTGMLGKRIQKKISIDDYEDIRVKIEEKSRNNTLGVK